MEPGGNERQRTLKMCRQPNRIVSLVPSITESLFDLGLGDFVGGITDYCVHPQGQLDDLTRVGGPKNPRLEDILALNPDLVLANQEENTKRTVEAVEQAGIPVFVTFPKTVRQAVDVLWTIIGLFSNRLAAARLETLELSLQWAEASSANHKPARYFCPIWKDETENGRIWWMTFNRDTYIHDLLALLGGENCFGHRERRYPLEADLGVASPEKPVGRDTRYPRVTLEEVLESQPELILLPSEPFAFGKIDKSGIAMLLSETPAVNQGRIHLVDGSLLTWHGTRLARALQLVPPLFQ